MRVKSFWLRVDGLGFRVQGVGFMVQAAGFWVWDLEMRFDGVGWHRVRPPP